MTTQEMLDWFDILQDKYASPYFTEDEKLTFLNRAIYTFIEQYFPDGGLGLNFELDSNTEQKLWSLIFECSSTSMDSNGTLDKADLVSDLQTISGDATAGIYKIISVEFAKSGRRYPCKYMRHNDKTAFENNYFKKPSYKEPKYLFQNGLLQFRPLDTSADIYITVIKTPLTLGLSPTVNSDLPEDTHNDIVAIALEFAGVASREEILGELTAKGSTPIKSFDGPI